MLKKWDGYHAMIMAWDNIILYRVTGKYLSTSAANLGGVASLACHSHAYSLPGNLLNGY